MNSPIRWNFLCLHITCILLAQSTALLVTGEDETQLSERSINDGITCWGRSSVLWDHPDPASRSGLWSLSCVLIGCLRTLLSTDWSRLGAWPWPRRAQTKCRLQSASRWVESVGWGKVHRPIERSINIFHRTLPHAQKRSKVMFPVDQGATTRRSSCKECLCAPLHIYGVAPILMGRSPLLKSSTQNITLWSDQNISQFPWYRERM